jgi:hypothetical protein
VCIRPRRICILDLESLGAAMKQIVEMFDLLIGIKSAAPCMAIAALESLSEQHDYDYFVQRYGRRAVVKVRHRVDLAFEREAEGPTLEEAVRNLIAHEMPWDVRDKVLEIDPLPAFLPRKEAA